MTALAFYCLGGYFPTFLQTSGGLSRNEALVTNGVVYVFVTVALLVSGRLADRVGRRTMIRAGAVLLIVLSVPAFLIAGSGGVVAAIIGQLMLAAGPIVFGGGSFVALLELFPTRTRLSGSALGYNAAYALFGGTAPLLASLFVDWTGSRLAPGFYMMVIAALVLAATWRVPETKDVAVVNEGLRPAHHELRSTN
jgi:MHS family proline/betaine transporter-like MFS transporter